MTASDRQASLRPITRVARNLLKVDAGVVHALLQARYYDGSKGEFLSEDPSFLAVGSPRQVKQVTGQDQSAFLADPQQMNSYSYASDNPLTKSDPTGNQAVPAVSLLAPEFAGSFFAPEVTLPLIAVTGAAIGFQTLLSKSNPGQRYIPFNQQPGRMVTTPSNLPDPFDPWDGWKPGSPKDWKTWTGIGIAAIGAATDIYSNARDLPSNRTDLSSGSWYSLPSIVIQGGSTYYRNYSGLLSTTPQTASGGKSGGLPATVTQNGATYYRNSSGLLSTTPGK